MPAAEPPPSWAIVGCGYVGARLARRLLTGGHPVVATCRSDETCLLAREQAPGASVRRFDLRDSRNAAEVLGHPRVVVVTAPPSDDAPGPERELARALPASRIVYISTTGVYAPGQGALVSDDHELRPASRRGQRRLDVERAMQEVHEDCICLRVPGIYGPGRGVHARMLRGDYRLIGAADTLVSRIHVDDLTSAIVCLGSVASATGSYVVGDEAPTSSRDHARGVATRLGLAEPPTVDAAEVSSAVRAMLGADRGVVPQRLHALGWRARYPSWREGLEQCLAEEGRVFPPEEPSSGA